MATICTITGTVKGPDESILSSVVVRATQPAPYITSGGIFVADYFVESAVNGSGVWTMDLAETATDSKKILFTIVYPTNGSSREKSYVATIPNAASANFADIATEV